MQASGLQPVTYGYDANSRLTGLTQGTQSAGVAYDAANRRTTLTLPNGIVLSYSYDTASRLIGQTYTGPSGVLGDLTYGFDATGNRLATGGSFARSGLPTAVPASSYDAANQQLTFGPSTQTFDANGNLLTQTDATGTTTYTWDARNRLTALISPIVSATFAYDALGRRTTKTINGQSTSVLYDGLDIVKEDGGAGEASYLRTLGIDEALSRTDASGTLTYLTDALGSTIALADSGGGLPTTYTYAPFGETAVTGLPSSSPFQFTGRENDGTGLYYYRARYYDPVRGRFISEDPIGFDAGVNFYRYAGSNPILFVDPFGLDAIITYWPNDAYGRGHLGIGVNTDQTSGYYPTSHPVCLIWGCDVAGHVLNDPAHHPGETPQTVTVHTTAEQDEAMQALIDQRTNNPGNYNLHGRNCAQFVEDVLTTVGVQNVPNTKYPADLFRALQAIANQQNQQRLLK
jgi:RHS repeat-associated protein